MSSASPSKAMPQASSLPKVVMRAAGGFYLVVDEAVAPVEIPQEESTSATSEVVPKSTSDVDFEVTSEVVPKSTSDVDFEVDKTVALESPSKEMPEEEYDQEEPPSATSTKVILKSSDGVDFEVDKAVGMEFRLFKGMIEIDCAGEFIPLPDIRSDILALVIQFCEKRVEFSSSTSTGVDQKAKEELDKFDAELLNVDSSILFDIILAANYLQITNLYDMACKRVADIINMKSLEGVREFLNIQNDFTAEEEAAIRADNSWAFEGDA